MVFRNPTLPRALARTRRVGALPILVQIVQTFNIKATVRRRIKRGHMTQEFWEQGCVTEVDGDLSGQGQG